MTLELYVSAGCPYCAELREQLDLDGSAYDEYDVDVDPAARGRVRGLLSGTAPLVPVLVEDGRVIRLGWQGRGCHLGP